MKDLEKVQKTLSDVFDYLNGNNLQLVGKQLLAEVGDAHRIVENLAIHDVVVTLPTYKEANKECNERIEDIKQTSSACANTDIHTGYRIGFIECYEYIKGN